MIEHFTPIREKIVEYLKNPDYLHNVLNEGNMKAREVAEKTMDEVKTKVGLGYLYSSIRENSKIKNKIWDNSVKK